MTKIFVTIPRLGLLVGAVGGAVMLLANLLLRRVTARAKARADKANLKPTGAGSAGGMSHQRSSAHVENKPIDIQAIASNLSQDERRYAIATAYLAQFAIFHDDFFKAIDVFDKTNLIPMPDSNQGRKRFFDPGANAAISIGNDACMIQLIGTELDKFAGPLETALTVTGGSASIKKVEPLLYAGWLVKEGKAYDIQVSLDATGEKPTLSAGIWRSPHA